MASDKEEVLTPEETEVNKILTEYDAKIAEVQNQLDRLNDPSLEPVNKLPGITNGFAPKSETEAALRKQIQVFEKQAKGRAAEIAQKCPPALQGKIFEKAEIWRNVEVGTKDPQKQIAKSFGFVERLRERGKFAEQQRHFNITKERVGAPFAENTHDASVKPSNYYSHLHFNDQDNPRSPDADREVSVPEPDKED